MEKGAHIHRIRREKKEGERKRGYIHHDIN